MEFMGILESAKKYSGLEIIAATMQRRIAARNFVLSSNAAPRRFFQCIMHLSSGKIAVLDPSVLRLSVIFALSADSQIVPMHRAVLE